MQLLITSKDKFSCVESVNSFSDLFTHKLLLLSFISIPKNNLLSFIKSFLAQIKLLADLE